MKYKEDTHVFSLGLYRIIFLIILVEFIMVINSCFASNQNMVAEEVLLRTIVEKAKFREGLMQNIYFNVDFVDNIAPGVIQEDQKEWVRSVVKLELSLNADGKFREVRQEYRYNKYGELEPYPYLANLIRTWDNEKSMEMLKNTKPTDCAVSIKNQTHVLDHITPWAFTLVGGQPLSEAITTAMKLYDIHYKLKRVESKDIIIVEIPQKTKYYDNMKYNIWLDPEKNYYPLRIEEYIDGEIKREMETSPSSVGEGLWLPISGIMKSYSFKKGEEKNIIHESKFTVNEVRNGMKFEDNIFEIELLKGYRVADSRGGVVIEYVIGAEEEVEALLNDLVKDIKEDNYEKRETFGKTSKVEKSIDNTKDDENNVSVSMLSDESVTNYNMQLICIFCILIVVGLSVFTWRIVIRKNRI